MCYSLKVHFQGQRVNSKSWRKINDIFFTLFSFRRSSPFSLPLNFYPFQLHFTLFPFVFFHSILFYHPFSSFDKVVIKNPGKGTSGEGKENATLCYREREKEREFGVELQWSLVKNFVTIIARALCSFAVTRRIKLKLKSNVNACNLNSGIRSERSNHPKTYCSICM